jgi:hypothetical protein
MNEIIAAIITGLFGLVGGLAVGYRAEIKNWFARSSRKFEGTWSGKGGHLQILGVLEYKSPLEYDIRGHFSQTGQKVKGHLTVISDRTTSIEVDGEVRGDYLVGQYRNLDANTTDWGCVMARLIGTGTELQGFFLGVRMREEGMAITRVEMTKE